MEMNPFCKGMAAGLIVGTTLTISFMPKKKPTNCIKNSTGKILKSAGNVIDSLQSIL